MIDHRKIFIANLWSNLVFVASSESPVSSS